MAEDTGDKTEQATPKKLEQAHNRGQFAKSPEVQTVFVLMAAMMALKLSGAEIWRLMAHTEVSIFSHLHDTPLTLGAMQGYSINAAMVFGQCVWPILTATMLGGLLAGGLQTRFRTSPEALTINWARLNPVEGLQRTFSMRSAVPTGISILKLTIIGGLTYGVVKDVMGDPIFHSSVDMARIAEFMAQTALKIIMRVGMALMVLASADYGYQYWRSGKDMMMTKEEVKDEHKSSEGNPQVKMQQKRKRRAMSKRKMLAEVPKADVVLVNPTHIAIALRYDRKTMKAPRIVAKGIRMNAQQIRDIAKEHQIPIVENIPLARLMFKYGRVGGEIPAQLYSAVAEVLAWVYRVNAYRYYREQNS
jgi:flagellar biosynthetic protein FlhB